MRDMDVGSRFAAPDSRQTLTFVLVAIIFPANQINIFDLYLHLFPSKVVFVVEQSFSKL